MASTGHQSWVRSTAVSGGCYETGHDHDECLCKQYAKIIQLVESHFAVAFFFGLKAES
jgi:hypothetical protein